VLDPTTSFGSSVAAGSCVGSPRRLRSFGDVGDAIMVARSGAWGRALLASSAAGVCAAGSSRCSARLKERRSVSRRPARPLLFLLSCVCVFDVGVRGRRREAAADSPSSLGD